MMHSDYAVAILSSFRRFKRGHQVPVDKLEHFLAQIDSLNVTPYAKDLRAQLSTIALLGSDRNALEIYV
jgi:hypothetical protein